MEITTFRDGIDRIRESVNQIVQSRIFRELRKNRISMFGIFFISFIVVCALAPSVLAPADPTAMHPNQALEPPSLEHPFGTNKFGQDVFSRVIYGARVSIIVGLTSVALASGLGVPLGIISGYYGGRIDDAIMRIVDGVLSFPPIILAFMVIAVLGKGLSNVILALGIVYSTTFARVARGSTLSVKEEAYIESARASGASNLVIMSRHVFPNIIGPLIVQATLSFAFAILDEAAFSYLGIGAQPPDVSWGMIIDSGQPLLANAPWIATFPGIFIMLSVLSYNVIGNSLRDALDPNETTRNQ